MHLIYLGRKLEFYGGRGSLTSREMIEEREQTKRRSPSDLTCRLRVFLPPGSSALAEATSFPSDPVRRPGGSRTRASQHWALWLQEKQGTWVRNPHNSRENGNPEACSAGPKVVVVWLFYRQNKAITSAFACEFCLLKLGLSSDLSSDRVPHPSQNRLRVATTLIKNLP